MCSTCKRPSGFPSGTIGCWDFIFCITTGQAFQGHGSGSGWTLPFPHLDSNSHPSTAAGVGDLPRCSTDHSSSRAPILASRAASRPWSLSSFAASWSMVYISSQKPERNTQTMAPRTTWALGCSRVSPTSYRAFPMVSDVPLTSGHSFGGALEARRLTTDCHGPMGSVHPDPMETSLGISCGLLHFHTV